MKTFPPKQSFGSFDAGYFPSTNWQMAKQSLPGDYCTLEFTIAVIVPGVSGWQGYPCHSHMGLYAVCGLQDATRTLSSTSVPCFCMHPPLLRYHEGHVLSNPELSLIYVNRPPCLTIVPQLLTAFRLYRSEMPFAVISIIRMTGPFNFGRARGLCTTATFSEWPI